MFDTQQQIFFYFNFYTKVSLYNYLLYDMKKISEGLSLCRRNLSKIILNMIQQQQKT